MQKITEIAMAFATLEKSTNMSHIMFRHGMIPHSSEDKRSFTASKNV